MGVALRAVREEHDAAHGHAPRDAEGLAVGGVVLLPCVLGAVVGEGGLVHQHVAAAPRHGQVRRRPRVPAVHQHERPHSLLLSLRLRRLLLQLVLLVKAMEGQNDAARTLAVDDRYRGNVQQQRRRLRRVLWISVGGRLLIVVLLVRLLWRLLWRLL